MHPLTPLTRRQALALGAAALSPLLDAKGLPRHGVVVAVSPPGADVGRDVLKLGGNAVDAAVATAFALAVTYPSAGNLGGGGFMVVHPAPGRGAPAVIDYREKAPAAASRTMFTARDTIYSAKAVGVPGTVSGLALAHAKFGKLPWRAVVEPAVALAEAGFAMDQQLASSLNWVTSSHQVTPEMRRVLAKSGGKEDWQAGDRLVQADLARTLRLIRERGAEGFYRGETADLLVKEMRAGGGLITEKDLESYRAKQRVPIHATYRGHDVYAPPPPSSGGVTLTLMLNMLETFDPREHARFSAETLHRMTEVMRRAYCDRARHLGDQDFVKVPEHLTSKGYAKKLAAGIPRDRATRSEDLARDIPLKTEGDSTTHFSVVDGDGMAVSTTTTLERSYGSRIVVRGAGFLLNNEMMDFNWFPGQTTRDGVIGTEANLVAPGKRMLSSMTPTVVARDGRVTLVTGSPGSRSIINTVLNVVVGVIDFGMDVRQAVDAPRTHHQWFPDVLHFEGVSEHESAVAALRAMGHKVSGTGQGDAHTIGLDARAGRYVGAEDRRINGRVAAF